jgi:hypothetical protein
MRQCVLATSVPGKRVGTLFPWIPDRDKAADRITKHVQPDNRPEEQLGIQWNFRIWRNRVGTALLKFPAVKINSCRSGL